MRKLALINCSIPVDHKNKGRKALVMTTTLHKARMNGPEEKPNNLGVERRFPGHLDIEPMWFINAAGNWPERKIDSNSEYKKKDAWRWAQAVILFLATYLMSSGPILVFF
jgi:hypothetical protein